MAIVVTRTAASLDKKCDKLFGEGTRHEAEYCVDATTRASEVVAIP
ncbi:hypothetical protein [Pseudoclavibacter helvolus]|nr:hypothetical protein [Pseudoclavibacter helvolus]